jgi:divalent metal cation (Fe/Co/Zn/Cd) transporter
VIGLILSAVAMLLAREAKGLLIGERAYPSVIRTVREVLEAQPRITAVNHIRTMQSAPESIFVAISADFDDSLTMGEGETLIEEIEDKLRAAVPELSSIYIRPEKRENAATLPPPGGVTPPE